jgi:hypothetical protein
LANRAILALRALFSGELSGLLLDPPRSRTSREWEAAPLSARTASDNVLRDVNLFLNGVEGVAPAEEAAFRRLTRNVGVLKSYGASVRFGSPVSGDGEPLRGTVVKMVPDHVSLPKKAENHIDLVKISRRARYYLQHAETEMFATPEDRLASGAHEIRTYSDPLWRVKENVLDLALKMFLAGMVGFCELSTATLDLFTVHKKRDPETGADIQRPVWTTDASIRGS